MKTLDISKANEQLDKLIDNVNTNNIPLTIINGKGKNAVLISEEKWNEAQNFLKNIGYQDIQNKLYENMRHEILNEKENQKVQ